MKARTEGATNDSTYRSVRVSRRHLYCEWISQRRDHEKDFVPSQRRTRRAYTRLLFSCSFHASNDEFRDGDYKRCSAPSFRYLLRESNDTCNGAATKDRAPRLSGPFVEASTATRGRPWYFARTHYGSPRNRPPESLLRCPLVPLPPVCVHSVHSYIFHDGKVTLLMKKKKLTAARSR